MPVENIHSSDPGSKLRARVQWGKDGTVQIATVKAPDVTINAETGTYTASSLNHSDGWFVDLNRDQINRLIRSLRKARDAAYGADA